MPYLIDGHNLIPKVPGLSLDAVDDEIQLVELLQEFCRQKGKHVEVFFDRAPPGGRRVRVFGNVTARFVHQARTADDAIIHRLNSFMGEARNWTVVSSDRQVKAAAKAKHARWMTSEEFAALLLAPQDDLLEDVGSDPEVFMGDDEVDEWLDLFGDDN
jgi:predicted RNA-binding protein with PIN domain